MYCKPSYAMYSSLARRMLAGCLVLVLGLGLGAVSAAETPPTPMRAAVFPFLSFAPLYIAQAEGYFEQEGLEVEFVRFQNNSESLAALMTGDIDVDAIFTVGLLNVIARGHAVRVVADKGLLVPENCPADGFLVRAELLDALQEPTPELLRSLTFGADPVWIDSYLLDHLLADYGLGLGDVRTEYVGNPAARMEALSSGVLDVAFFSEPWITRVVDSGGGVLWRPASSILPYYSLGVINFGPGLLSSETGAETGERFLRAYLRGIAQYQEGKTDRNVGILVAATQLDETLLRRVCWPSFAADGAIDAEATSAYAAWAADRGIGDQPLGADEIFDAEPLRRATRER